MNAFLRCLIWTGEILNSTSLEEEVYGQLGPSSLILRLKIVLYLQLESILPGTETPN